MNWLRWVTVIPGVWASHHESGDAAPVALGPGHDRHHHQHVGDHTVGGPQLGAVEHITAAILGRRGRGPHASRVAAHIGLGEQERADQVGGHPGQEAPLLLLGAKQPHRLGHADRLVGAEQHRDRRVRRCGQDQGAVVVHLGQAKAAIALLDLDSQRAQLGQAPHNLVGNLGVALDLQRVDRLAQEPLELGQEGLALALLLLGRAGVGVDQVEPEPPQEQLLAEARPLPVLLARCLGLLAGALL
jgi:hypothetical protein